MGFHREGGRGFHREGGRGFHREGGRGGHREGGRGLRIDPPPPMLHVFRINQRSTRSTHAYPPSPIMDKTGDLHAVLNLLNGSKEVHVTIETLELQYKEANSGFHLGISSRVGSSVKKL